MKPFPSSLRRKGLGALLLAYLAFIALGMPDGLLGVAWPTMRAGFDLPLDAIGVLLILSTCGYMTSSFFSGALIARLGVGRLLAASCALTGAALIAYTLMPQWGWMLPLAVCSGLGAGAIDAGLNVHVAAHYSPTVMQGLHASYGAGVMIGPFIMTLALQTAASWRPGYLAVGAAQIALAAAFSLTVRRFATSAADAPPGAAPAAAARASLGGTLRQGRAWLSMLLFYLYVGAEVTLGIWTYSLLTEGRGMAPALAGLWAGGYWAFFTLGRVLATLLARRLRPAALAGGGLAAALAGALLLAWHPAGWTDLAAVVLIGLAIAPIFPALVSSTRARVGARLEGNLIGMQMAASGLGGATLPALVGALAEGRSLEVIPLSLVALFALLLALYAAAGAAGKRATP